MEQVRVLAVCTGNVCRSPAIEVLLAAALDAGRQTGLEVASAGTHALVGEPVSPPMARLLAAAGVATDDFRAHQLTAADLAQATVVVTATRQHRDAVARLRPAVARRTFALLELAELAGRVPSTALVGDTPQARLAGLVQVAPSYRGELTATPFDVVDPWQRPDAVYAQAFDAIFGAVLRIVAALHR